MSTTPRRIATALLALGLLTAAACSSEESTGEALQIDAAGDGGALRDPARTTTTIDPALAEQLGETTTTAPVQAQEVTATTAPPETTTTAPQNIILIQDDDQGQFFEPFVYQVPVGQPVTWRNVGTTSARQIVNDDGVFVSPEIPPGGEWTFTFTVTGVFDYRDVTRPYATSGRIQVY